MLSAHTSTELPMEATPALLSTDNTSMVGEIDTLGPYGAKRLFWREGVLPWGQGVSAFSIQATVGVNGKPEEGAEHHSIYLKQSGEMPRSQQSPTVLVADLYQESF